MIDRRTLATLTLATVAEQPHDEDVGRVEARARRAVFGGVVSALLERAGQDPRALGLDPLGAALTRVATTTDAATAEVLALEERELEPAWRWARELDEPALPFLLGELHERFLAQRLEHATTRTRTPGHSRRGGDHWRVVEHRDRRAAGAFYTPPSVAQHVVERAVAAGADVAHGLVVDLAVGGGAFLIATALTRPASERPRWIREHCVGVDVSAEAVAVARLGLWWLAGAQAPLWDAVSALHVADALLDPLPIADGSVALVVSNPPWVAYAGRAAKPLPPSRRAALRERFRAFAGYPTLHAAFVERAAELARHGTLALLLPSATSDLAGYAPMRRVLTATHRPHEPLLELGEDAFGGVVQPCYLLLASATPTATSSGNALVLAERSHTHAEALTVEPPAALAELAALPPLPPESFRELGFQTTRAAHIALADNKARTARHTVTLLQGRDVTAFRRGEPRLFLDPSALVDARLRPASDWRAVQVVVRQTAAYPIAALHDGGAFRNSLLAAATPLFEAELLVALLNSTVWRAAHVAAQRDARQAAFPQLKIGHLRRLPTPDIAALRAHALPLARRACHERPEAAPEAPLVDALDRAVALAFGLSDARLEELRRFLEARSARRQAGAGQPK